MNFRLRHCVWEITLGCCFSCKYCGSSADGKKRENELTTEECIDVAKQLKELGDKAPESLKQPVQAEIDNLKKKIEANDTEGMKAGMQKLEELLSK